MKNYFYLIAVAATMFVQQVSAEQLYFEERQIGCGTITSVRSTNQYPMYNEELSRLYNINGVDSSSSFQQAASYGLIGVGAAIVGSILVDSIGNANNKLSKTPVDGLLFGRKVLALQITLDDNRVINLPLMEAQVSNPFYIPVGHPHEVGRRVQLAHNEKRNDIQVLNPRMSSVPVKGDSDYEKECELRIDKDLADAVIKSSEHVVDESLIIFTPFYTE